MVGLTWPQNYHDFDYAIDCKNLMDDVAKRIATYLNATKGE
jgi:hypothetical protein